MEDKENLTKAWSKDILENINLELADILEKYPFSYTLEMVTRHWDDNTGITTDITTNDIPNGTYEKTEFYFTTRPNQKKKNTPACTGGSCNII
jgi:hypothetical protein